MRITRVRDQFILQAAGTIPPVPAGKPPGRGQENPSFGQQTTAPAPQGRTGDWTSQDWRTGNGGAFHSPIRPPMSSDIPHPNELFNEPGNKRHQNALARTLGASEDPEHDPWNVLAGTGHSFENLVQNHMSHQQNMSPEQGYAGRVWYQAAHDATKDLADKTTGHHGKTVATMSAFSPKTGWDENMEKGHHFLTHYDGSDPNFTVPGMGSHTEAAKAIYHSDGDGWKQALTGPKRSAFANNILDATPLREPRPGHDDDAGYYHNPVNSKTNEPDWRMHPDQDSTIDTHHVRMSNTPHGADLGGLKYETPNYFGKKVAGPNGSKFDPSYDLHSRAAWEATRRINAGEQDPSKHLVPKQVQAGPWTKFKADVDAAGKGANLSEPGVAPKSYDEAIGKGKSEEEWAGKHPLTNPIPRYEKDLGDWNDPRRPTQDLRQSPNWHRRSSLSPWWDNALSDWMARHPQHNAGIVASRADRELLAYVDEVLAGSIDFGPEFQRSVMKDVDETGGFSRRGPQKAPDKGFMVAQPGAEHIEPSPGFSGKSIADYGQQHADDMGADPDLYQGGWDDKESGDFYHDMSKHHDDIWDAAKAGYGKTEEDAQHGIYDLNTGVTFSPLELGYKGEPGYMMARRERGYSDDAGHE